MTGQWSDYFIALSSRRVGGNHGSKTNKAEEMIWKGCFEGRSLCVISTVRLLEGNMAHFLVHSGARIGTHDWDLRGGHYVDLRVLTRDHLKPEELRRIGELARTEDIRPVRVRQGTDRLDHAVAVPDS